MSSSSVSAEPLCISYLNPQGQSVNFLLSPGKSVFAGVAKNCSLQLTGEDISPIHCRISFDGQSIRIYDWMSASGTFVDGQRIEGEVEVPSGSQLQLGSQTLRISGGDEACFLTPANSVQDRPSEGGQASGAEGIRESWSSGKAAQAAFAPSDLDADNPFGQDLTLEPSRWASAEQDAETRQFEQQDPERIEGHPTDQSGHDLDAGLDENPETRLVAQLDNLEHKLEDNLDRHSWNEDAWTSDPSFTDWVQESAAEITLGDCPNSVVDGDDSGLVATMETRIRDLVHEAELSDRRISVLEDLLLAAESAQSAQVEERQCLENWLQDIERKFGEREAEHLAVVQSMQHAAGERQAELQQLHQKLVNAAGAPDAQSEVRAALEELRAANQRLQEQLQASQERCRELEQQVAGGSADQTETLRVELAKLAQERAELARQRHELVNQLTHASSVQKNASPEDSEMACRLRALREHLREIHQQEQQDRSEITLTSRLSSLWHRVTR